MDVVYRLGEASAAAVVEELDYEDAHDSIRVTMTNLEKKGFLGHHREGARKIYTPAVPEPKARRSAMKHLVETFFGGSPSSAILEFLRESGGDLSDDEIEEIRSRIAKVEGSSDS